MVVAKCMGDLMRLITEKISTGKPARLGTLGKYDILSVLPNRFARFLCESHDFLFSSLDLPPSLADRSDFDVPER
jgi:hypothetical protein